MGSPFFSVVMPVYNPPDLIFRTLDSVFAQTFKDFELIVVDDCSPQDVKEKLSRYVKSDAIRYVRNEVNSERAVSRNHGMRVARGQWVAFLDHDDILYPECLQKAHNYAIAHPEIGFFHNLNAFVDPDGKPIATYRIPLSNDPAWDMVNGNFLACNGTYVRRDVFEKVQFDETKDLIWSEDYEYWLRVLAHTKKLGRIEEVLSAIVEHPARTVHKVDTQKLERRANYLVHKVLTAPEFQFYSRRFRARFVAIRWLVVSIAHCDAGSFQGSWRYLWRALAADPSIFFQWLWPRNFLRLVARWFSASLKPRRA